MGIKTRTSGIMVPAFVTPTSTLDADTTAWIAAVVANGGSVSAGRQTTVNTLILALKSGGIWTNLDRLWIFAAENTASALTDLTAAHDLAAEVGAPTFTVDRGYTGTDAEPATKYIDTTFNPSTQGITYTQNSAHHSTWIQNDAGAPANGGAVSGCDQSGTQNTNLFVTFHGDDNVYGRVNDVTPSGAQGGAGGRTGHWVVNRSGAAASQIYKSNALFSSPNDTSSAISNASWFVCCSNSAGSANNGSPNRIAAQSMGGSLAAGDVTSFYNALQAYMTAVGA